MSNEKPMPVKSATTKSLSTINRAAVVVRPKEAYLQWVAQSNNNAPELIELLREKVTVYLLPDGGYGNGDTPPLRNFFAEIFETELTAGSADKSLWPQHRTLNMFSEWFDINGETMIVDLADTRLKNDKI
ncbi:hypothetical protein ACKGJO_08835 [Gracilimonas sp. Q87]|uniref:hypothetical protein n=1 Tax=Gracilimonas sp. Q87 TaxID=3384766 RepID=UPI003984257C